VATTCWCDEKRADAFTSIILVVKQKRVSKHDQTTKIQHSSSQKHKPKQGLLVMRTLLFSYYSNKPHARQMDFSNSGPRFDLLFVNSKINNEAAIFSFFQKDRLIQCLDYFRCLRAPSRALKFWRWKWTMKWALVCTVMSKLTNLSSVVASDIFSTANWEVALK